MSEGQEACACDNWICPHNEEKIAHLPGVVKGVAWLKGRVEDMRALWMESESHVASLREKLAQAELNIKKHWEPSLLRMSGLVDAAESQVAALAKERDDFRNGAEVEAHEADSLRAKLAALTAPVEDEGLREALECVETSASDSASAPKVIARALRQSRAENAALKKKSGQYDKWRETQTAAWEREIKAWHYKSAAQTEALEIAERSLDAEHTYDYEGAHESNCPGCILQIAALTRIRALSKTEAEKKHGGDNEK